MNYYYDIILNWNEEIAYDFYEWNETDNFELIKKIPLFKIKHKTLIDLLTNKIIVNEDFLLLIKDKTLISGKNVINKISYACLFTDNKNVIGVEFSEDGLTISKSKLLIDDELNVLEVTYGIKEYNLIYEIKEPLKIDNTLRQEKDTKKVIALELKNLYHNRDISKLKYLYYEYKKEKEDDIKLIFDKFMRDLDSNFNQEILKLYYIIKLSYHNV